MRSSASSIMRRFEAMRSATKPIKTVWKPASSKTAAAINETRRRGGRVVAVGTTVVRTLETAAGKGSRGSPLPRPSPSGGGRGDVNAGSGETNLVILPGDDFEAVDALVTNFHLPRSSLLLLVSAFAGRERVLEAYAEALEKDL